MGFRYLNQYATDAAIAEIVDLADLAAGGGADAANTFELSRRLADSKPMRKCILRLKHDPDCAALIAQRRRCGPYAIEALKQLPKGSLGHTYATVMEAQGYDIAFYPDPAFYNNLESEADYINYRVFATHDLHHIISGFSLDNFGENGVISISIAQFSYPGFSFLNLASLMIRFFESDTPFEDLTSERERAKSLTYKFRLINEGLAMGLQAKPLFPVIWEERMGQDLDELRRELEIEPVREGPYSWYSNPTIMAALA